MAHRPHVDDELSAATTIAQHDPLNVQCAFLSCPLLSCVQAPSGSRTCTWSQRSVAIVTRPDFHIAAPVNTRRATCMGRRRGYIGHLEHLCNLSSEHSPGHRGPRERFDMRGGHHQGSYLLPVTRGLGQTAFHRSIAQTRLRPERLRGRNGPFRFTWTAYFSQWVQPRHSAARTSQLCQPGHSAEAILSTITAPRRGGSTPP